MTPGRSGDQATFAAALLDPTRPCPPGMTTWNDSDPTGRLAVYRNNVVSSLIDALADTFPVVQELVGPDFFRAMAALFVRQDPPRSRVLAHYGADFPAFVDQFDPARSVPYLADVARLEFARVHAFHAADAQVVSSAAVNQALASGERISELLLLCHPSVAVVNSAYAVVSLWAAHQREADVSAIDPDVPESAFVVRDGLDVVLLRAPPGSAAFLTALQQGQSLGAAATAAMDADAAFDLSTSLALLLRHGALSAIHLPRRALS